MSNRNVDMTKILNEEEIPEDIGLMGLIDMSWSRLDCYNWCSKKYKHKYCDELEDGTSKPLKIGSIVHNSLESIVNLKTDDEDELVGIMLSEIDKVDKEKELNEEDINLIKENITSVYDVMQDQSEYETIGFVELGFRYIIGRALFLGFIDVVYLDEDELGPFVRIKDYKTGKTITKTSDSGQMKLYTIAVKKMFPGLRVKSTLHWTRKNKEDTYEFSDSELEEFLNQTAERVENIIDDETYQPTQDGYKCTFCAYAEEDICKKGFYISKRIRDARKRKKAAK